MPPEPSAASQATVSRGRRRLLGLLALAGLPGVGGAAATTTRLIPTPAQALGPFYPKYPDPTAGNDLATVNGQDRAEGTPLRVTGRVLDTEGQPQAEVLVEIWQTNAFGRYHHPDDESRSPLDRHFRGYGRDLSRADGRYEFRTIVPVAYPGRTPHIHFKLSRGRVLLVTQMYLPWESGNARDGLFSRVRDPTARGRLLGVAVPGPGARTLAFDIVVDTRIVGE